MDFSALNFRFHRAVTEVSGYSVIGTLQDHLFDRMDRGRMIWMVESHREKARGEHRAVVDAIERKDAAGAKAAMEQHWLRAGKDFTARIAELRERAKSSEPEQETARKLGARRSSRVG
jgi:DNA-binding GntR family transcriptional regulator